MTNACIYTITQITGIKSMNMNQQMTLKNCDDPQYGASSVCRNQNSCSVFVVCLLIFFTSK